MSLKEAEKCVSKLQSLKRSTNSVLFTTYKDIQHRKQPKRYEEPFSHGLSYQSGNKATGPTKTPPTRLSFRSKTLIYLQAPSTSSPRQPSLSISNHHKEQKYPPNQNVDQVRYRPYPAHLQLHHRGPRRGTPQRHTAYTEPLAESAP